MRVLTKKDKDINQLVDVDFNNQYLKTNFMHSTSCCLCRIEIDRRYFCTQRNIDQKYKDIDQIVDVDYNNQYLKTNFMHLSSGCLCRIDMNFACRLFFLQTQEVIMMSFRFWLAAWFM